MLKARLSVRLAFAILLMALSVVALDVGYRFTIELPQARQNAHLQLQRLVNAIEPVLIETLQQDSERLGQKTLSSLQFYPSIQSAWLLDSKGDAVAAWVRQEQTPLDNWQESVFQLQIDGQLVGEMVVESDSYLIEQAVEQQVLSKLLLTLLMLILPLLLVYGWVRRKITGPLLSLTRLIDDIDTENLTRSDFEHLRSVDTQGEVRQLSLSFLALLQTLSQTMASRQQALVELRQLAETLEDKVSERTRDLQKAKDDAEQAGRAKNDFMSVMTHELRTPLNGIIGFTGLLQKSKADARTTMLVDNIGESASNLLLVVNDIIDYASLEGVDSFSHSMFSPLDILMTACRQFESTVAQKDIELSYHADANLLMRGDGQRLMLALRHLISNAVKFTDEGVVDIQCTQKGEYVEFVVTDTGRGIDLDNMNAVLQAFSQGETGLARSSGGIGMGLAIVSRIVDIWGGELRFSQNMPNGTIVTICLPLALKKAEI